MGDAPERIAGKTLAEWREFARRDDCLDRMVPIDLRMIIAAIAPNHAQVMANEKVRALVEAIRPFDACVFNDNGDVTISTGHLSAKDWLRLRAVLHDLEAP